MRLYDIDPLWSANQEKTQTMKTTLQDISNKLTENGIPHMIRKVIGIGAEQELDIEVFSPGIVINNCESAIKDLLSEEKVKVTTTSNDEVVRIKLYNN